MARGRRVIVGRWIFSYFPPAACAMKWPSVARTFEPSKEEATSSGLAFRFPGGGISIHRMRSVFDG